MLEPLLKQGLNHTPPWTREILRLAVFQLHYLDRIPVWAVASTAVELARKYAPAQAGLVNAVIRRLGREGFRPLPDPERYPVQHLAVKYSYPEWLVAEWAARLGWEEAEALCQINNEAPPLTLRVNTLKTSRANLLRRLAEQGYAARPSDLVPEAIRVEGLVDLGDQDFFTEGWCLAQDEASMLVSRVLDPAPGSFVIDACAGPGTKTTHLAQMMQDKGRIQAIDIHPARVRLIEENCCRLGITSIQATLLDARELAARWPAQADYILVDAPCSGTGALRRRPDLRWRQAPAKIYDLKQLQQQLLTAAVGALRPGGVLVYSTCSLQAVENDEIANWLEATYQDLRPEGLIARLPEALQRDAGAEKIQLWPQRHDTDGFFIARWQKRA